MYPLQHRPGHSASRRRIALAVCVLTLGLADLAASSTTNPPPVRIARWVRSWGAAIMAAQSFDDYPGLARVYHDVTLRQLVVTTASGRNLRIWLSNEYGSRPLLIGRAHVARSRGGPSIDAGADRELRFSGHTSVSIPPGVALVSDPVDLETAPGAILSISIYLPGSTEGDVATVHEEGWRTGYVSTAGDHAAAATFPVDAELHSYFYLSAVDVEAAGAAAIVALGDSITDGTGSTAGTDRAWPNDLARRLNAVLAGRFAVINMGIGSNRVLHSLTGPSTLQRVDRDVFAVPGVRFVIVFEGINDIGDAEWLARPEEDISADDLIGAFRQLIDRAHEHSMVVLGGTLTPTGGCQDAGFNSPISEAKRVAVNAWIRDSGAFDAVLDFDRAIRDPANPVRLNPDYDSGDHLHPNDAGYQAMADAIDLSVFQRNLGTDLPKPRK